MGEWGTDFHLKDKYNVSRLFSVDCKTILTPKEFQTKTRPNYRIQHTHMPPYTLASVHLLSSFLECPIIFQWDYPYLHMDRGGRMKHFY